MRSSPILSLPLPWRGVLAGFFEEIGWSGFATPHLLKQHGVLTTGLILGVLWGTWHLLADYWGNAGAYGSLYPLRGLLWVVTLTAYRILMVWVYSKTTSLGLMQLMHASFTGGQALWETPLVPTNYLLWYGAFSLALWLAWCASSLCRLRSTILPSPWL